MFMVTLLALSFIIAAAGFVLGWLCGMEHQKNRIQRYWKQNQDRLRKAADLAREDFRSRWNGERNPPQA